MPSELQKKGYQRDRALLEAIASCQALDTEQVRVLLFPGKYGRRKAQERLKTLYDRARIKRWRPAPERPYIYYHDKKHGRIEHLVALNWVRCWMLQSLKSWENLYRWEYEQNYGVLQSDAFTGIMNIVTGKLKFYFIEMDVAESGNAFDKVEKYVRLYDTEAYAGHWWVEYAERFPVILVVTTSASRVKAINELIGRHNRAGLRFEIQLLEDLKKEMIT